MTRIAAVCGVLPPHRYEQHEITDALAAMGASSGTERALLNRVHAAAGVRTRHLALPLERYGELSGFGAANDTFIEVALELGERAVRTALDEAGISPQDVHLVISTSVTGIAAPSLETRLAGRLGLRPDVKRVPIFGIGCAAGAAGIARLHDYLRGWPGHTAVLVSTELCSLTFQKTDASMANRVAGALFGDGAAAVVAVGEDHDLHRASPGSHVRRTGPAVVAARSRVYPGTERVLGWDIGDQGFQILLDGDLPALVRLHVAEEVRTFLADHDLKPQDVAAWVCHPGGPKVLDALGDALGLPNSALAPSRRSLAEVGNLSSASVLHVLRDILAGSPPPPGAPGLMLALGPGFCSELVLLRW